MPFMSLAQEPEAEPVSVADKALVLTLSDEGRFMVDRVQAEFLIEALDSAEELGYREVILKIDTFGGVVMAAREITERLLRLNIPTTAFVETKAISAGIFIAWSCDEIVMEKHTTIGDAQMIMQTPQGIEVAPEKAVTVYRSDWKKSSDAKGRSFALAQGFFEQDAEVLQTGEEDDFSFYLRDEYDLLPEDERPPIIQVISKAGQLLTLHAEEAEALGVGRVSESFEAFLAEKGLVAEDLVEVDMNFNQQVLRYLGANPWIYLLLVLIGLNGLYMELKAPGFGIPGFTALICFVLLFGSRYLLGTATPLELIVFVLGLGLTVVEIFVLPGLGIAGVSGLVLMIGSMILASLPDFGIPQFAFQWNWIGHLLTFTMVGFFLSMISVFTLIPLLFKIPVRPNRDFALEFDADQGYVIDTLAEKRASLEGKQGIVRGGLRPSGKVELDDGSWIEASCDSGFLEDGLRVSVIGTSGNYVIVHPVEEPVEEDHDLETDQSE
jgi:membrane-bound serine protease (ClpP class)